MMSFMKLERHAGTRTGGKTPSHAINWTFMHQNRWGPAARPTVVVVDDPPLNVIDCPWS
jgi:hypothetical protein